MAATIVHFEVPAGDADRAQGFYSSVFGWPIESSGFPGIDYRMVQGEPGGAVYASEGGADGITIYFGSEDIEATLGQIRGAGGEAEDRQPIPGVGWFARCKDTEGNSFSVFQSDESVAPPAG